MNIITNYVFVDQEARKAIPLLSNNGTNDPRSYIEQIDALGGHVCDRPTVGWYIFGNIDRASIGLNGKIGVTSRVVALYKDPEGGQWAETASGTHYCLIRV